MANEVSASVSLSINRTSTMVGPLTRQLLNQVITQVTAGLEMNQMTVPNSATAIPLGGVTQPHWCFFWNSDPTNFIRLRNGSGGADLVRLHPGEACVFPMYFSAVPYAIAEAGSPVLEYLLLNL